MLELANRLFEILDFYEIADTGATVETVAQDITNNPTEVIDYLLTLLEETL